MKKISAISFFFIFLTSFTMAQDAPQSAKSAAAELARKLANPVASLISVPFQNNSKALNVFVIRDWDDKNEL